MIDTLDHNLLQCEQKHETVENFDIGDDDHFHSLNRRSSLLVDRVVRRMSVAEREEFDRDVNALHTQNIQPKGLEKKDSAQFMASVKTLVDDGTRQIKCPIRRQTIVELRPIATDLDTEEDQQDRQENAKPDNLKCPIRRQTIVELRPIAKDLDTEEDQQDRQENAKPDNLNPQIEHVPNLAEEGERRKKHQLRLATIRRVQKQMQKSHDPCSFSKSNDCHAVNNNTLKSTAIHLRQQLRKINTKLHQAFKNGHTRDIDIWSKKLHETNKGLLVVLEKTSEAGLGAVVCLLHLSHVGADGTSKRLWKPVHTVGGKWLEKTRQHRSYIRHKRNMIALHPGTVKSRRTLSPLLKKKVKRLPLDSEIQMAKFSYCHHRVLRPNGSSRGIACHV
jgi:hypothetical protein